MKLYRTKAKDESAGYWAGSQAEAAGHRKKLNGEGHKRDTISTEEVEVPTNKAGLLEFLNQHGV